MLWGKNPEKKWFSTMYTEANTAHTFGSGVYAVDHDEAKALTAVRNFNERAEGGWQAKRPWSLPSRHLTEYVDCYVKDRKYISKEGAFEFAKMPEAEIKKARKLAEKAIHGTTFLSFIALNAGTSSVNKLLSDQGILHAVIHIVSGVMDYDPAWMLEEYERIIPILEEFEKSVPGVTA